MFFQSLLIGVAVGLIVGMVGGYVLPYLERREQRAVIRTRLAELTNGRKNGDLTVKIDPIS